MLLLGMTGGIGMGKSTTAGFLAEAGVRVVDTDELARQVVEPGQPALDEIRERIGREFIRADGTLDRSSLARAVFSDPARRRDLEMILHPRIRAAWETQVGTWRKEGHLAAAVIIPLLFETGAESSFDHIVCVACSATTQRNRLRERGWHDDEIRGRLAAQLSPAEKMTRSQFVIWTEGPMEVHREQLRRILSKLAPE